MPIYAGEASPARALKCAQSGIFLPTFAIFRTVPISFGLAQQARVQVRSAPCPAFNGSTPDEPPRMPRGFEPDNEA